MAQVKRERQKRLALNEEVVVSDELVRNFAQFSGVMLADEFAQKARHWTGAAQGPDEDSAEGHPEAGEHGPSRLSNLSGFEI